MIRLDIKTNFAQVDARLRQLQADVGGRALVSAVNKTIEQAKVQMARAITAEFNLQAGYVKERLRVRRASARQGRFAIEAELIGSNKRRASANIIAFVERNVTLAEAKRRAKAGTLGQLFVKIKRKGGKKPLHGTHGQGAFIGNRGRTVFERVPGTRMASRSGGKPGSKHAEKIVPVQTIDVAQMFNTRRINSVVVKAMLEKFPAIFEHEARFYTQRFSKP